MSITHSPKPRFGCRVIRTVRAISKGTGHHHTLSCADCQAFFRAGEALDDELRQEASALRQAASMRSPRLERRILRAVRDESVEAAPSPSRIPAWAIGAVPVMAIAAVLTLQKTASPSARTTPVPEDAVALVDAVENLTTGLTETVIPRTGAILADNPLQQELGSVYSDARSALDFLALNFLPSATRVASPEPTSKI